MILYFSGTGNSAYIAKKISEGIEDTFLDLFEKIRNKDYSPLTSQSSWVVVCPTYAWQIPRILRDWLLETDLDGSKDVYFVMTCGGDTANAGAYAQKLCEQKGLNYMGCAKLVMPENYIAIFNSPSSDDARQIIAKADERLPVYMATIVEGKPFEQPATKVLDRLYSGLVNKLFYSMIVHAKKFYATSECVSCGLCEKVCPLNNVHLKDGNPVWGSDCTHCMACINKCPSKAIEYGKHTIGLSRYTFPKDIH